MSWYSCLTCNCRIINHNYIMENFLYLYVLISYFTVLFDFHMHFDVL